MKQDVRPIQMGDVATDKRRVIHRREESYFIALRPESFRDFKCQCRAEGITGYCV